jgi:hypothetical protein
MLILLSIRVMASYKKHLAETRNTDLANAVNLYTGIEAYFGITGTGPRSQKKKEELVLNVCR